MPERLKHGQRIILKLSDGKQDYYLEWSTKIKRPITFGMSLEEFKSYYLSEYGEFGRRTLTSRLERVERTGTSSQLHMHLYDFLKDNMAGGGGKTLSPNKFFYWYCIRKEDPVQRV